MDTKTIHNHRNRDIIRRFKHEQKQIIANNRRKWLKYYQKYPQKQFFNPIKLSILDTIILHYERCLVTTTQIKSLIDAALQALADNPASEVVEFTHGNRTIKRSRDVLRDELAFWREELARANKSKRTITTRFK